MMRIIYLIIVLFSPLIAFSQQGNEEQWEIAKRYVKLIRTGEYEKSWDLFDKENNPQLTKTQYIEVIKLSAASIPDMVGELEPFMYMVKFMNDQTLSIYTFKFEKDVSKPMPSFTLEIIFMNDKATLIAGVQPKRLTLADPTKRIANSSAGKETHITGKAEWKVNNKKYQVIGVNIVHFQDNEAIVTVQVAYPVTKDMDMEVAKEEAKELAKHLYKSKDYKKANKKMKELKLTSLKKLGVSFINPQTGQGWNSMIKPEEYKK